MYDFDYVDFKYFIAPPINMQIQKLAMLEQMDLHVAMLIKLFKILQLVKIIPGDFIFAYFAR